MKVSKYIDENGLVWINIKSNNKQQMEEIEKKFSLKKAGKLVMDAVGDEGYQEYVKNNSKIEYSWNPWFPFRLSAKDTNSNKLIEEIYDWLKTIEISNN